MTDKTNVETYDCPWCKEPFGIDPNLRALPYDCPHCDEGSWYSTLQNPNVSGSAVTEYMQASEAIAHNIHKHTFGFINEADDTKPLSTGTMLSIDERSFVMTCRHTIPAKPKGKLRLIPKEDDNTYEYIDIPIIKHCKEWDSGPDVGFLEVESDVFLNKGGITPLGLDRIADFSSGLLDRPARVLGYPADWVEEDHVNELNRMCGISLGSCVVDPKVWNSVSFETRNPDPTLNVVLYFNRKDTYLTSGPGEHNSVPEPFGMSGGGFWQSNFPLDYKGVWTPERFFLYGIQSSWPRKGRYLKGVQVIHLLRLIAVTYPELRDELTARFPRLKTLSLSEV